MHIYAYIRLFKNFTQRKSFLLISSPNLALRELNPLEVML